MIGSLVISLWLKWMTMAAAGSSLPMLAPIRRFARAAELSRCGLTGEGCCRHGGHPASTGMHASRAEDLGQDGGELQVGGGSDMVHSVMAYWLKLKTLLQKHLSGRCITLSAAAGSRACWGPAPRHDRAPATRRRRVIRRRRPCHQATRRITKARGMSAASS